MTEKNNVTSGPTRDSAIDAIRTACLMLVIVLHALMVGVESSSGSLVTSVAMDGEQWFAPLTWALQVMPMFFIAGGFASISQWRVMRQRGYLWTTYAITRVRRLVIPAGAMIAITAAALAMARAGGMRDQLAAEAGHRIAQPLWFLAVYVVVSALVPAMARLHERAPRRTIAALAVAIGGVDLIRVVTDQELVGYLNLVFVWLFAQQLGFFAKDWRPAQRPATAAVWLAGTVSVMVALVATGLWSSDLIANLNPPTILMALLAVAHLFLLRLIKPTLDRVVALPAPKRLVAAASRVSMTVYLWHMPLIMVLVGIQWWAEIPMPEPHSAAWWATRIPWLALIAAALVPVTALARHLEDIAGRIPSLTRTPSQLAALAVIDAAAGITVALLAGVANPLAAVASVGMLATSVLLPSASTVAENAPEHLAQNGLPRPGVQGIKHGTAGLLRRPGA